MEKKPYYITTAIAYTSAKPHLGNTYEILVLSQAVQTEGFADAQTALDTAFGKPGTYNPWAA